jgi:hypothetical protein
MTKPTLLEHLEDLAERTETLRGDIIFGDELLDTVDAYSEATQQVLLGLSHLETASRHFKLSAITLRREQNSSG